MNESDLTPLATRVVRAPYPASIGMRVETIAADRVQLRVPYQDANSNPGRALHGGVAASAIAVAGTLATAIGVEDRPEMEARTLDLSVVYLSAAIGEDIIVAAEVLRRGKEIAYSDVDVRTPAGKRIAKGLVTSRAFDYGAVPAARARQRSSTAEPMEKARVLVTGARAFVSGPFIARLGMEVLHADGGEAILRLPFGTDNADADESVHEGAVAALIDTSGALASWSITGLNFTYKASTVGIHVNFHGRARREDLVAVARTLRRDNESFLNSVTVSAASSGVVVATGSVTYRIVVND